MGSKGRSWIWDQGKTTNGIVGQEEERGKRGVKSILVEFASENQEEGAWMSQPGWTE